MEQRWGLQQQGPSSEVPIKFQIDDSAPLTPMFTWSGAQLGGKLVKIGDWF